MKNLVKIINSYSGLARLFIMVVGRFLVWLFVARSLKLSFLPKCWLLALTGGLIGKYSDVK
jgi:hypothetical protein